MQRSIFGNDRGRQDHSNSEIVLPDVFTYKIKELYEKLSFKDNETEAAVVSRSNNHQLSESTFNENLIELEDEDKSDDFWRGASTCTGCPKKT